jgi:glutamate synthase domain-containing protein 3
MLKAHHAKTGSKVAKKILDNFEEETKKIW